MKGDFSRISFDPSNHFSQVLLQQGRVTLDADANEQSAILLHYLRALARDLIGPYGGPADHLGFVPSVDNSGKPVALKLSAGHYYVDGILCESAGFDYANQPDYTAVPPDAHGQNGDALLTWLQSTTPRGHVFWIYLDVWQRYISAVEDERIREVALGGPDTSGRVKLVWQVKAVTVDALRVLLKSKLAALDQKIKLHPKDPNLAQWKARSARLGQDLKVLAEKQAPDSRACAAPLNALTEISDAQMAARLDPGQQIKDPCVISPDALYRGAENQLYRVEIHQGAAPGTTPTFKWSRDNGSILTAWLSTDGNDLIVGSARGFDAGCWVELSDDRNELYDRPGMLVKLAKVEGDRFSVDPDSIPSGGSIALAANARHPKVRRWDQTENDDITLQNGAVPIVEASDKQPNWIDLEDGVQVQFAAGGDYRSGDYWLIPARVATGSIDWPKTAQADGSIVWLPEPPAGIHHHYAPLGFLSWVATASAGKSGFTVSPCTCRLSPTNSCAAALEKTVVIGTQPLVTAVKTSTAKKRTRKKPASG